MDLNLHFVVMPLLRHVTDSEFERVDEVLDFIDQFMEVRDYSVWAMDRLILYPQGLEFMHRHGVAHL